jgi:predicted Holliday junction resolvase-like endonuclease
MKKVVLVLLLVILVIAGYYVYKFSSSNKGDHGLKQQALVLKKHSAAFNQAVATAMNVYFEMKTAFVDADTSLAKNSCRKFIELMDSIPLNELKNDTAKIYEMAFADYSNIQSNAASLLQQTDILEMRKDFGMVSENLYPFFRTINYEGEKMYWQFCPMAFGEEKGANWISNTKEIFNPYLGKNHPEYKATMLHCGQVKDSITAH